MEDPVFLVSDSGNTDEVGATISGAGNSAQLAAKFDEQKWLSIEKKLSQTDLDVLKVLIEYSFGIDSSVEHPIYSISDDFYRKLRDTLVLQLKQTKSTELKTLSLTLGEPFVSVPVEEQSGIKSKGKPKKEVVKKLSKADEIRQKISTDRIKKSVSDILATFKRECVDITSVSLNAAINSNILEIKGIGLAYACAWVNHHRNEFNNEVNFAKLFDIIATTQRFINICSKSDMQCISLLNNDKISPSPALLEDLRRWVALLRSRFVKNGEPVFNWKNIQQFAPQIFVQSEYQKILPQLFVKIKKHQKDIVDAVKSSIVNGAWIIYDAMIGSGKTTGEIGIAALISHLRISNPSRFGKLRFLSVCNSESVQLDVAQKMYNAATTYPDKKLHFAISHLTQDAQRRPRAKIVKSNSCPSEADIVTIVASPAVAKLLLEANSELDDDDSQKYQYILFVDEGTMGADNLDSKALYDNVSLNHVSPYITINSSATFPSVGMLSTITNDFSERFPTASSIRVYSDEISIGCDIRTLSGQIVVPHLGACTQSELEKIVTCIKECSFLGKTYTPSVVDSLYTRMTQLCIAGLPDIPLLFTDVDNLNINRVRQLAIELLSFLITCGDQIIQQVCATTISDDGDCEEDDEPVNTFTFQANPDTDDIVSDPINYSKLGTTQAYRLQGQTLIATDNPEQFVLTHFAEIVDRVYASETSEVIAGGNVSTQRYKSTGDAIKRYSAKYDIWEKKIQSIEKNSTSPDDKEAKLNEHEKLKPVFPFPSWAHVGTEAHANMYARSHRSKIVKNLVRGNLNVPHLTDPDKIINVDDRILTALFCGIAIYSTETVKCRVYLDIVLQLASAGALAYVVADSTICFGTNYPFFNVIITKEFSELHSMLVLFQVMGRAGRPGRSPKALIIVPDSVALRIINFVTTSSEADFEARNMETIFQRQKLEIEQAEERRVSELVAKTMRGPSTSHLTVLVNGNSVKTPTAPTVQKIAPVIVPLSDVPDGSTHLQSDRPQRSFPQKNGDWRNTRSSEASDWKRTVPSERADTNRQEYERRDTRRDSRPDSRPNNSANGERSDRNTGFGGSKYVPPAMRNSQSSQEKAPRHKTGGSTSSSSSSGWKKESK